jgi:hypothetical protein
MVLLGASTQAWADTGSVSIKVIRAGFVVGAARGIGTLTFRGKRHRLAIGGIGAVSPDIAEAEIVGPAHNLRRTSDIAGAYGATGSGSTVVGGGTVARLQNANDVILELRGVRIGIQASSVSPA